MLGSRSVLIAVTLSAALLLTGCATEPDGLSLAATKSPVQLLRNEAWYRLPPVVLQSDSETSDVSVACDSDESGLTRFWSSSTTALITNSQAPRARTVADDLIASFVEQGWVEDRTETADSVTAELTSTSSVAGIEIEVLDRTDSRRASIRISASGPCVATDGPESDEVRTLEHPQ
jgi:hypothetical protein